MITRDPLKIPVRRRKDRTTFDDSYSPLPGRDLAAHARYRRISATENAADQQRPA